MAMAAAAGLTGTDLPVLHKMWEAGLLKPVDLDRQARTSGDPNAELKEAQKKKNDAVGSWAHQRLRLGEFRNIGQAIRACHAELGDQFGVWADSTDVTTDQVRKARSWADERANELKNRAA